MTDSTELLWPPPERARAGGARWSVPERVRVRPGPLAADDPALRRLDRVLEASGRVLAPVEEGPADLVVHAGPDVAEDTEGYRLVVDGFGAHVEGASARGAAHGLSTLAQWIELSGDAGRLAHVLGLEVHDAPATPFRGAMLDVSRSRVPTVETLERRVERMAAQKLSRLQLYTEHTFAYRGHEAAWRGCDPLTAEEVRALDDYADARGIELQPNQQSFGHLHRFLRLPEYRDLAECPDGVAHPFSEAVEPFSLDPSSPRALEFLAGLYDQLLPCFRSRTVNVGLDETFDLGLGRSRERCEREGKARVYLDFVRAVHGLLAERDGRMQMWADVLLEDPSRAAEVPRGVVPIVWGYEGGFDFRPGLRRLRDARRAALVAPGTSSWQSFCGRPTHALANVRAAAAAQEEGLATGLLVTDWGDRGHHQPEPACELGLLLAAGLSWRPGAARDLDEARAQALLARHVFHERTPRLARALLELGRAGEQACPAAVNGTAPFFLVSFAHEPLPHPRLPGLAREPLAAARERALAARAEIDATGSARQDAARVADELRLAADLVLAGLEVGLARLELPDGAPLGALPGGVRRDLADRFADLTSRHRALWIERSRPGGLEESAAWLERVVRALEPDALTPSRPGA